jgi:hypothetical protein
MFHSGLSHIGLDSLWLQLWYIFPRSVSVHVSIQVSQSPRPIRVSDPTSNHRLHDVVVRPRDKLTNALKWNLILQSVHQVVAPDYGLDGRGSISDRGREDFSSNLCVQTCPPLSKQFKPNLSAGTQTYCFVLNHVPKSPRVTTSEFTWRRLKLGSRNGECCTIYWISRLPI